MASLALSSSGINVPPPHTAVSGKFDRVLGGGSVFHNRAIFTKKRNTSTIVNVATEPPPAVTKKDVNGDRKLVAWTSIKQERWEGELHVQGQIPQWLVCKNYFLN